MTELQMFSHLLDRPELYLPRRSGDCLLAFIAGLEWAVEHGTSANSAIMELLRDLRADFPERYQHTTHRIADILSEMSGGDDRLAFDLLREKLEQRLAKAS